MMDICPEKPGFFELLSGWARGERDVMAWLAFASVCMFVFLTMLTIQAALT